MTEEPKKVMNPGPRQSRDGEPTGSVLPHNQPSVAHKGYRPQTEPPVVKGADGIVEACAVAIENSPYRATVGEVEFRAFTRCIRELKGRFALKVVEL